MDIWSYNRYSVQFVRDGLEVPFDHHSILFRVAQVHGKKCVTPLVYSRRTAASSLHESSKNLLANISPLSIGAIFSQLEYIVVIEDCVSPALQVDGPSSF